MKKWVDMTEILLILIGALIYIGAKVHFFTRYQQLSTGAYLEEHSAFWAGIAIVALLLWTLGQIRTCLKIG